MTDLKLTTQRSSHGLDSYLVVEAEKICVVKLDHFLRDRGKTNIC